MLSFRSLFRKEHDIRWLPVGTTITIRAADAPPECIVKPTLAARRSLALVCAISNWDLSQFIESRLERFCRRSGGVLGTHEFNAKYHKPHTWNDRRLIEKLIYDEMCDWMMEGKARKAADILAMLAATRWKAGDIDPAMTAADKALAAFRASGQDDGDLIRLSRGIKGLGYMYWGMEAIDDLNEGAKLEDRLDLMLQMQFSTCMLDALVICHKRAGHAEKASLLVRFADEDRVRLPYAQTFSPSWGVRTPPWLEGAENEL